MPTDNRFGFDDNKRRTPIVPEFGQPDPEDAFGATEPSAFTYTLMECELLPESEVFEDERLPSYAGCPDNSHDRREKGRHWEVLACLKNFNDFGPDDIFTDYDGKC